jgi:hypothetical protein
MTTSSQTKDLRQLVEAITGFRCSVRNIKKGSLRGNYMISPSSLDDSLWSCKQEFERLGFIFSSAQSAFLPYNAKGNLLLV